MEPKMVVATEPEPKKKDSGLEKKTSTRETNGIEKKESELETKESAVEKKESVREKKDSGQEKKTSTREKKGSDVEKKYSGLEKSETELENEKPEPPLEKEEENALRQLPYYHGHLVRDAAHELIQRDGDFLLRLSEGTTGMQILASIGYKELPPAGQEVAIGQPDAREQVRTSTQAIIRNNGRYYFEEKTTFGTVRELVDYYGQNPYMCRLGSALRLKKGIALKKWEYKHSDVKLGQVLGEGAFGMVQEGVLTKKTGVQRKVAVKLAKYVDSPSHKHGEKILEMMKEAKIMKALPKHSNVVRLEGVMLLEQPIGIILELAELGCINRYLRNYEGLVEIKEKVKMCSGAAAGLSFIHSKKLVHCDIAARNCLYSAKKVVKISDFGLSRFSDKPDAEHKIRKEVKLPIKWLAPETIKDEVFSMATDVYSFGVCCWEIFSNGAVPFDGLTSTETKTRVKSGQFLELPGDTPLKFRNFVNSKIFQVDKDRRLPMCDIARFMEHAVTESKMAELLVVEPPAAIKTQMTQKTESAPRSSMEPTTDMEKTLTTRKPSTLTARKKDSKVRLESAESMEPKKKGTRKLKSKFGKKP